MPTPTYDLIASTTLAASASEVVFGSLPQTYRDLVLITTSTTANVRVIFNADSGTNYPRVSMTGNGSTATSATAADAAVFLTASAGGFCTLHIMDYSATDKHKTALRRRNDAANAVDAGASRWANTAAIILLTITAASGDLAAGSTFTLYGIAS